MEERVVLTFDIGTQSMRGMFVDSKGNILDFEQIRYEKPYFSVNPGWAEQSADFYYHTLCKISATLIGRSPELSARTMAVTLTTVRDTVVCLDKEGKPLRDAILWLDKREAENVKPLPKYMVAVFRAAGVLETVLMQQKQSVCNWIMDKEPDVWAKTDKYVMLSSYLNFRLTGELKDTDSNQVGHVPFDYKNRRWMKERGLTRCMYDVPAEKLCPLIKSGEEIGRITGKASKDSAIPEGLPLIATGSDKACETLGLSVTDKDKAALSFGTTATVHFATDRYFEPVRFVPCYPAVPKHLFNPEVQIYRGYWMLSWFKKEFAAKECEEADRTGVSAESLLNKHLREIPAGSEGLILQPYWTPGVVNPSAKGAIIGFSDVHTRAHVYRAIIEGIGFGLMDGMYSMEKRGKQKIKTVFVAGGGSQSEEICQITANMFGLPVKRIQTHEAAGLGSAMVAFVAKGVYADYGEATKNMVRVRDTFLPDEKEHRLYEELYRNVYCGLYGRLEPLYKKIKKIISARRYR